MRRGAGGGLSFLFLLVESVALAGSTELVVPHLLLEELLHLSVFIYVNGRAKIQDALFLC